ncbi:MAG TPA: DNA polymerase III subunit gamma/tau [Oscillospiraceae bacterium]|nr:DNA polymerase III subunit gamma/tau [Oscillospiraceae bacterium]HNW04442.1 DNA polymerase III subunit gamma/tau [Oscillospiraceae bacterium]
MYQALYRKYRPRRFGDVAGQEHITTILAREVAQGTFAHAYLFTGSRGIGKTTCAKILAKAVNCPEMRGGEPCGVCPICRGIDEGSVLDVEEIDAATNRNIDDIRSLRDEAGFTPVLAKYRVYILDEAHMLTREAANALLKILEEPPEHVIFILATTEPHKLPATIVSRCLRFDFKRLTPQAIAERVGYVCGEEGMEIDGEAALLIGKLADGGMRDALSLLDVCRAAGERVTVDTVTKCAGLSGREHLFGLAEKIAGRDVPGLLRSLEEIYSGAADASRLCDELIGHFRNLMVAAAVPQDSAVLKVSAGEQERLIAQAQRLTPQTIFYAISVLQDTAARMGRTASKRLELELAMVKLCSPALSDSPESMLARIDKLERELALLKAGTIPPAGTVPAASSPAGEAQADPAGPGTGPKAAPRGKAGSKKEAPPGTEAASKKETDPGQAPGAEKPEEPEPDGLPAMAKAPDSDAPRLFPAWEEALAKIRDRNRMIFAFLAESEAYLSGNTVLIDAKNETFIPYMQRNEDARSVIKDAITEVSGRRYGIGPYKKPEPAEPRSTPLDEALKRAGAADIPVTVR